MKVVICAYDRPNYIGGPHVWLRRIAPALRERGVQVRVLFFITGTRNPDECPILTELQQAGFDCAAIPLPTYTEQRVRWILQQIQSDPPDIFVPNLMVAGFYAARWVREAGIPTIGILHSSDPFHAAVLDEFVFGNPHYQLSALICVSRYLEHTVLARNPRGILIRRITCAAVPTPEYAAAPPTDTLRLIYVGRLVEEQKRISDVTRALCRVVQEVPNTTAAIYGSGPACADVAALLHTYAQDLPVKLMGSIDNAQVQNVMLQHHVFVLLSDYEGLSVALMEAMACGLVPVCKQMQSGFDELIIDGITGIVVQDRGDSFVAAIQRLRNEPQLWGQISTAARERVQREFTIDIIADQWLELFTELSAQASIRRAVVIPRHIEPALPPLHPALAREDHRTPPLLKRPYLIVKRIVYRMARAMKRAALVRAAQKHT